MNPNAIKKILVIREGKIGDLLMITPTIEALAKRYPYSKIDLLINNYGSFVFENNPKIDEIIFYDRKNSFGKQIKLLHKLRKEEYDLIFIFEESSHHKILAYLIGGKIRVGFSGKHNQLLTHYFPWEKKHHAIDNNLKLLTPSLEKNTVLSKKMILNLKGSDLRKAKDFLKLNNISENDKIVFIHPACGKNEKLRTWPPENIAKFSDMLISSDNVKVILHCGPNEEEVINQILPLMKNKPVVNRNNLDITSALIKL
ncbi:MAG: glycosyltransferase family 9 protein, partial [Rhodothermaceae bacterium]